MVAAMKRYLVPVVWIFCLSLAFWLGRLTKGDDSESGVTEKAARPGTPAEDAAPGSAGKASRAASSKEKDGISEEAEARARLIAELRSTLKDPSTITRLPRWLHSIEAASPAEMEATAEMLAEASRRGRQFPEEARIFWNSWGAKDGSAAMAYLEKNPQLKTGDSGYQVAQGWAAKDPHAAMEWIRGRPATEGDKNIVRGAMKGWAERDFSAATAYVLNSEAEAAVRSPDVASEMAWTIWYSGGEDATARWFDTLRNHPDPDLAFAKGAFNTMLEAYGRGDQQEASVNFLRTQLGNPWCDTDAVARLLFRVSKGEPEKMVGAIVSLGPDPESGRYYEIESAIARWSSQDANGPGLWLKSLQRNAPAYDEAAAAYAESLTSVDSAAAVQWAGTIKNEELRRQTLSRVQPSAESQ